MKNTTILVSAFFLILVTTHSIIVLNQIKAHHKKISLLSNQIEKIKNIEKKYSTLQECNDATKKHNILVRKFPNKLYADINGNKVLKYFTSKKTYSTAN